MSIWHLLQRFTPTIRLRWIVTALVLGLAVLVVSFILPNRAPPPLQLLALSPEGRFQDTASLPAAWADTLTASADAVTRFPLILGVRNPGTLEQRPERLELSLPLRYRLTGGDGAELDPRIEEGSPLLTYTLRPGLGPVEPQRMPVMLPGQDTLWLEVIVPDYYCVALADSIPEFVPAPPPPLGSLATVRMFYSFAGGDLGRRQTGTLNVLLDTTAIVVTQPEPLPSFPMVADPVLAEPALESLLYVGSRRTRCGQPEDPMELLSTVWETPGGGRFIALDYGGVVRKHLYDLDGDGVIERESWDPDRDGTFEATRRASLRIPSFLLPVAGTAAYDMAAFDQLDPDSLARLDPFRAAMPGPGMLPPPGDSAEAPSRAVVPDSLPAPRIQRPQPLGTPIRRDTTRRPPPDTSGGPERMLPPVGRDHTWNRGDDER